MDQALSIFGNESSISVNAANISCSLKRVAIYISQHFVTGPVSGDFVEVVKSTWNLVNIIYVSKWDLFIFDREKKLMLNKCIAKKFTIKMNSDSNEKKSTEASSSNQTPAPVPVPALLTKTVPSFHVSQAVVPPSLT